MRRLYVLSAVLALGVAGLIGWATLGTAQPLSPTPGIKPAGALIERVPAQLDGDAPVPGRPAPSANGAQAPIVIDPLDTPTGRPTRLAPQPIRVPNQTRDDDPPARPDELPREGATGVAPEMPARSEVANAATQPSISMEWSGPGAIKIGSPAEYTLTIRNTATIPVQKVMVQARVPGGVEIVATEPKAEAGDGVLLWDLGNLLAKQDRKLTIKFTSPQRGDLAFQAWVTFTGSSVVKVRVREPKLLVKLQAPERVLLGEPANVIVAVSNPGDHPVDHVKVATTLDEGLETVRGNKLNYELGLLGPGETRTITVPCVTKTVGPQKCTATAEGDGLKSTDNLSVSVVQPRIDLAIVGPKLRYLDKKAVYVLRVTNPGDAPAANVFATEVVPAGFKFVQADSGGQHDETTSCIKWFVGEIGPGQTKEVKFELLAATAGEFTHKAFASGARGMKAEHELKTAVEGLSAILMEVVDLDDPVEVGSETAYEVRVTNTGSKAETDIKLVCTIPVQMKLKSISAPLKYEQVGNEVIFQSLPRLSPKADVVYKIVVTAQTKGDARFKAALTTGSLVEPVIKVEPTKVYQE